MKRIGDFVGETVREDCQHLTIDGPYVFAHNDEQYFVWHSDTGEIAWVGEILGAEGYRIARNAARILNEEMNDEEAK